MFENRYSIVTDVDTVMTATIFTIVTIQKRTWIVTYHDFHTTHPFEFEGGNYLVVNMRWTANTEGAFSTCDFPDELKVKYELNLLYLWEKDQWALVTQTVSHVEHVVLTYEKFLDIFRAQYVSQVERGHLALNYMSLKQKIDLVTQITIKFTKRALFFLVVCNQ